MYDGLETVFNNFNQLKKALANKYQPTRKYIYRLNMEYVESKLRIVCTAKLYPATVGGLSDNIFSALYVLDWPKDVNKFVFIFVDLHRFSILTFRGFV